MPSRCYYPVVPDGRLWRWSRCKKLNPYISTYITMSQYNVKLMTPEGKNFRQLYAICMLATSLTKGDRHFYFISEHYYWDPVVHCREVEKWGVVG